MINISFNKDKAIASILYIANKLGKVDLHKLNKILYFADQRHLVKYGTTITGDSYIKMKHGPVPSKVRDICTNINDFKELSEYSEYLIYEKPHYIIAKVEADMDEFSDSNIECLDESILSNKELSFNDLVNKSHKQAYNKAVIHQPISLEEIAKEGGANDYMLKYIELISENDKVLS